MSQLEKLSIFKKLTRSWHHSAFALHFLYVTHNLFMTWCISNVQWWIEDMLRSIFCLWHMWFIPLLNSLWTANILRVTLVRPFKSWGQRKPHHQSVFKACHSSYCYVWGIFSPYLVSFNSLLTSNSSIRYFLSHVLLEQCHIHLTKFSFWMIETAPRIVFYLFYVWYFRFAPSKVALYYWICLY